MATRTLPRWLAHVERSHPKTVEPTLDRVASVRDRLGLKFNCPVIVVAGTNGKGSTCALIEAMARAAGLRVGLYSKPHLVNFEERCRIDGAEVAPDQLIGHFAAVEEARQDTPLTYFEFTTLVIARCLAAAQLDLAILEVGLGGRLDAVNIFDADCSVITAIDLDHEAWLGDTRESIGLEKAGVMRGGKPCILSDPQPPHSVRDHGRAVGAVVFGSGLEFIPEVNGERWTINGERWTWRGWRRVLRDLPLPAIPGRHQLYNAAGAIAALDALDELLAIPQEAVAAGLRQVSIPARVQVLPGEPTVVLDVSHNVAAVKELFETLRSRGTKGEVVAVFGCMADKAVDDILNAAAPYVARWHFCEAATERACSAQLLEQAACKLDLPSAGRVTTGKRSGTNPAQAFKVARRAAQPATTIVVFGSFHVVGDVIASGELRSLA